MLILINVNFNVNLDRKHCLKMSCISTFPMTTFQNPYILGNTENGACVRVLVMKVRLFIYLFLIVFVKNSLNASAIIRICTAVQASLIA